MVTIKVVDLKGAHWLLGLPDLPHKRRYKGRLMEIWALVFDGPVPPNYNQIPLPVFTDWWPEACDYEEKEP